MKRRKSRPKRQSSELHRGPWQRIPRVGGGAESDFTIRGGAWFRLPRGRQLVVFGLGVLGTGLWTAYFAWSHVENLFELLGAMGAVGRGFAIVVGGLGVILAVAYYYTAGIDWPRETAGRILVIGAVIGLFVVAAIVGPRSSKVVSRSSGRSSGRRGWLSPSSAFWESLCNGGEGRPKREGAAADCEIYQSVFTG